jgi:hypothetical protein
MQQTVIWTALPNGIDVHTKTLFLSVRVSPRLVGDQIESTLEKFNDFAQWASTSLTFELQFGDNTQRWPAAMVSDQRDTQLWSAVFPAGSVNVISHQFDDYRSRRIRSFPVVNVLGYVRDRYQEAGLEFPGELPPMRWLIGDLREKRGAFSDLVRLIYPEGRQGVSLELDKNRLDKKRRIIPAGPASPEYDFLQTLTFHEPKGGSYANRPKKPVLDFHEIVSMVEEYPPIMRRLGLIFDLKCAMPAGLVTLLKNLQPADRWVRVWPHWTPKMGGNPNIRPRTAYHLDIATGRFEAAPSTAQISKGLLDLSQAGYDTVQVDVDGAAVKLTDFTNNLVLLQTGEQTPATPDKTGLPAMRTGGLSVVRTGRCEDFWNKLQRAGDLNDAAGDDLLLQVEDLTRGFRVDVFDTKSGFWRSLCQRREVYNLRTKPGTKPAYYDYATREASVTASVTSKVGEANPDLYLHEALFHWDGWSLAVRRPGKTVPDPNYDTNGSYLSESAPPSDDQTGLIVRTDLVREADGATVKGTLPRLRFGRTYRLRARLADLAGNGPGLPEKDSSLDGATAEATYRRYEPVVTPVLAREKAYVPGESMERLVIRTFNDTPSDNTLVSKEESIRDVAPPRTSQQTAEQLGMFDVSPPAELGGSWYDILVNKHGDGAQLPDLLPSPLTDVPYLPDPLAGGSALAGLPGDAQPRMIEFAAGKKWPSVAPFRIRLAEGDGPSSWDAGGRVLTVYLPKAGKTTLRLSSFLRSAADLDLLGIWDWLRQAASPERLALLEKIALSGGHWMLTPFREVTLVHAVQKPLTPPSFEGLEAKRDVGATFAKLAGKVRVHGNSTGKVEIRASWRDRIDTGATGTGDDWSPVPAAPPHYSHAFDLVNGDPPNDELDCAEQKHEFGDTRYRLVNYEVKATSRFSEYFDPAQALDFSIDSKAKTEVQILNTARPAAPEIEYVIPLFGWEQAEKPEADGTFSKRSGGGVRVYLRRPWFSSGDGELLGVVLAHGPQAGSKILELPGYLTHYVTQWGFDPVWRSYPVYPAPTVHHFPLAVAQETGVTIEEAQTAPMVANSWLLSVAGHEVSFDAARQLWYCDIAMDTGPSYYPFVRLALARYQPRSVWGAQLSRVALAEFVQLAPDRLAWISGMADNPRLVRVSVSGPAAWYEKGTSTPTVMVVRVEMRHPGAGDKDVWLPTQSGLHLMGRTQITTAATVWSGLVPLPEPRGTMRFRLVVEEYEVMKADSVRETGEALVFGMTSFARVGVGARLVYADTIEL